MVFQPEEHLAIGFVLEKTVKCNSIKHHATLSTFAHANNVTI